MPLTEEELAIVMEGMDKHDYSHMGHPRFLDLESLTKQVENGKRSNPGKSLKRVRLIMSQESYPPHNTYEVVFE